MTPRLIHLFVFISDSSEEYKKGIVWLVIVNIQCPIHVGKPLCNELRILYDLPRWMWAGLGTWIRCSMSFMHFFSL